MKVRPQAFMARAKGRGTRILKRTSHITVVVGAGK
jgi:large subunit ribosomal protein L22